jgi:hypothetical protein
VAIGFLVRSIHPAFAVNPETNTNTTETSPPGKILWINVDSVDLKYKAFTAADAQAEEIAIRNETDKLRQEEAQLASLEENAMKDNAVIMADITVFLDAFSHRKNADYILGYGSAMNVLYANTTLDVTTEVVDELNKRYRKKKKTK